MRSATTLICLLLAVPAFAETFVVQNVHVIPMTSSKVLENQTVVIRDGRIQSISKLAVPADKEAKVIDGTGKFLMPGLADMHAHVPAVNSKGGLMEDNLLMFLANGVTTLRSMFGQPGHTDVRNKSRFGQIIAPNLYVAGPVFSNQTVASPQEVAGRVRQQKKEGWDLLKVHSGLTMEQYDALARTAKEEKIRFGGHIPAAVGLMHALDMGHETIEHMEGYIEYLDGTKGPVDPKHLDAVVKKTKEAGAWVVPTSALVEIVYGATPIEKLTAYPELKYSPQRAVDIWTEQYNERIAKIPRAAAANVIANRRRILRALHDGGVKILLGTDALQQFIEPGFSVAREMESMREAGLSNYDILRTATVNPAEYLGLQSSIGTVEVGKRADLVLLDANPLQDVANVAKVRGVMIGGRWFGREDLDLGLSRVAEKYARVSN